MDIVLQSAPSYTYLAQAYGTESYGTSTYTCQSGQSCDTPTNTGGTGSGSGSTTTAPNTGFLGLSNDAVLPTMSGVVLIAIALVGALYVIASRVRARKHAKKD